MVASVRIIPVPDGLSRAAYEEIKLKEEMVRAESESRARAAAAESPSLRTLWTAPGKYFQVRNRSTLILGWSVCIGGG